MLKSNFVIWKIASLLLAVVMILSGCGTNRNASITDEEYNGEPEELALPITDEPITIKYWCAIYGQQPDMNENEMYKDIEKKTGIHVEFINPPVGQDVEQYGLMLASKDLPDIIERGYSDIYPGGVQKALDDGVFLKLNNWINRYAPNYKALIEKYDDVRVATVLDSGDIPFFRCVNINSFNEPPWAGPIVRKDYLDKLGMEKPETPDEWYTMLKRFKNELNIESPLSFAASGNYGLASGFNTSFGFYMDNGTVKFGPLDDNFYEMLLTLQKWYAEGLIEKDFAAKDAKAIQAGKTNGTYGAWFADNADFINLPVSGKTLNPEYSIEAAKYLVPQRGQISKFGMGSTICGNPNAMVSAKTKYPKEVIKWLDYSYSDEGYMNYNYGIKGVTYELDSNNKPQFTEFMTNNPDGITFNVLKYKYKRHAGPYLRDYAATPEVNNPIVKMSETIWKDGNTDEAWIPGSLSFTNDEQQEMTPIMNDVNTYLSQWVTKTVMGMSDAADFETFKATIKSYGIDNVIGYYQAAIQRYNQRLNK